MTTYAFADVAGGSLAFVPAEDRLLFGPAIAAAFLSFVQDGPDLLVTAAGQTLRLTGTTLGGTGLGPANFVFEDGSTLVLDGAGSNLRSGTAGGDWIAADRGGSDTVQAGDGNDRIEAGAALDASDRLQGGAGGGDVLAVGGLLAVAFQPATATGIERIEVRAGTVTLVLDDATVATATPPAGDVFTVDARGQGPGARLTASAAAVVSGGVALLGGAGNDSLRGGERADLLAGGAGDDTLAGGGGDDTIAGGGGADRLTGGAGADLFDVSALDAPQSAPAAPDLILDFEGAGAAGGDLIRLPDAIAIARVLAFHVAAADFAFAGYAESGQQLPAARIGDGFADVLWRVVEGAAWRFELWADLDDDGRFGAADLLLRIAAAPGEDPAALVAADLAPGLGAFLGGAGADVLAGLGGTDDVMFGEGGDDSLSGGDGADVLDGGPGADTLDGGDLADELRGGPGSDWLDGGAGWDTLFAADPATPETEAPADRNRLSGGARPDALFGGAGLDTLDGGEDGDLLWGEAGEDSLLGGAGDDVLSGGAGEDRLDGGEGDDTLAGGAGADVMAGGAGAELFVLDLSLPGNAESAAAAPDWITDFDAGTGDLLSLGATGGLVTGVFGLAPLVWRGALPAREAAAGLALGLALPGGGIGPGYHQAWWIPATEGGAPAGGWFVVDLDQDMLLGGADTAIRLGAAGAPADLAPAAFLAGTFRGQAGTEAADTLVAAAGGQDLFGLGGDDAMEGGDGPDRLFGGAADDTLRGGSGADQLWGGAGDDRLEGGEGEDELFVEGPSGGEVDGSLARSTVLGGAGRDSLWGADGRDWLDGGEVSDRLYGGAGGDTLLGADGDDTLEGGDGADSIEGGAGGDSIEAGAGEDTVAYDPADPWVEGGEDTDLLVLTAPAVVRLDSAPDQVAGGGILRGFEGVDAAASGGAVDVTGSSGRNRIIGGAFADMLDGQGGEDLLDGGTGDDTLRGGEGDDLLIPGAGADWLDGGAGRDTVSHAEAPWRVSIALAGVGRGAEAAAGDTLIGFEGAIGSAFADTITGGAAGDWIDGAGGYDSISAFGGNDTILGGAGFNTLRGGGGDDSILGGPNAETIDAGEGNDTIIAGGGADHMWGGAGNDAYVITLSNQVVYEPAGGGEDTVFSGTSWYLRPNVDWFVLQPGGGDLFAVGTAGDERLLGNEGANLLLAGDGDDTVRGGGGGDRVHGHGGQDHLIGEAGSDIIFGGEGNDTLEGGDGVDNLNGDAGNDTILGGPDATVDVLRGGAGEDWLDGGPASDAMYGGLGNDTIVAWEATDRVFENPGEGWDVVIARGAGAFTLPGNVEELRLDGAAAGSGNAQSNRITGSFRDETLVGGEGNDTLAGAGGNDVLFGEAGRDAFLFAPGLGADAVADFVPGTDRVLLQGFGLSGFEQVLALARDGAGGVVLDLAPGDAVQLAGVAKAALLAGDFVFLA